MKSRTVNLCLPGLISVVTVFACGGDPIVITGSGDLGAGGTGGDGGSASGGTVSVSGGSGGKGSGGSLSDPCAGDPCGIGQRCEEDSDGDASCVDNECSDLDCSDTEECVPASGGGNVCVDNSCDADVDCPLNRYCDGEICVDDACSGGTARCDDDGGVLLCTPNGGEEIEAPYACESGGYFDSTCDDSTAGAAGCTCEDDWDCPEFTACEAGVCVGTGVEPTCSLPPQPFEELLPEREFHWGGTDSSLSEATGKAFPWSAQVISTPIVINLDDDNGDGKANELDFPEILFMTYHGQEPGEHGVVRAVHGGGPNKGEDYFALCNTTHWLEGDPVADDCNGSDAGDGRDDAIARPGGALAAGDLDGDGFPEIVVPTVNGSIQILNNRGEIVTESDDDLWPSTNSEWKYPAPAIANLDFQGLAEIIVGNRVIVLSKGAGGLEIDRVFTGDEAAGTQAHFAWNDDDDEWDRDPDHHGPMVCVADLTADSGMEIVAGTSVYRLPPVEDCGSSPNSDWCEGNLQLVWDAASVSGGLNDTLDNEHREGLCAVADVLGATGADASPDNALDGEPEVIVLAQGNLLILDGATGTLRRYDDLNGTDDATQDGNGDRGGGPPNIDDFDGDGFPEIATALEKFYTVIDLQPTSAACPAWPNIMGKTAAPLTNRTPGGDCDEASDCADGAVCNERIGQCVCLHNGWKRQTEDDSSRTTSSSLFDFNGDGAAEVVYNDECYFRIYEGSTGRVYLQMPSLSRTINENPVVADVDNDGNAEIIFLNNNETRQCGEDPLDSWDPEDTNLNDNNDVDRESLPNGIDVWGDPSDTWVAARRIWNQSSYHVTNVTEGGGIPLHEPESWKPLNGRLYNTYRSQPRNYNVAPDLALTAIQISSPDVACGSLSDTIQIVVEVRNQGDLRVGPGVVLSYEGTWEDPDLEEELEDENGDPLTFVLDKSLEPGASTLITVEYEAGNNGRDELPVSVRVVIDGDDAERECVEDNNDISSDIEESAQVADLRLEIESVSTQNGCDDLEVELTVYNDGSSPAEDVLVYLYAGDPAQGGTLIGETTIAGPIEAGDSETVSVELDPIGLDITLFGVADPANAIAECNDANNLDEGPFLDCDPDVR